MKTIKDRAISIIRALLMKRSPDPLVPSKHFFSLRECYDNTVIRPNNLFSMKNCLLGEKIQKSDNQIWETLLHWASLTGWRTIDLIEGLTCPIYVTLGLGKSKQLRRPHSSKNLLICLRCFCAGTFLK